MGIRDILFIPSVRTGAASPYLSMVVALSVPDCTVHTLLARGTDLRLSPVTLFSKLSLHAVSGS